MRPIHRLSFAAAWLLLSMTPAFLTPPAHATNSWSLQGPQACTAPPPGCNTLPGGYAGRTKWAVQHPTNPAVFYAAHSSGGVWKSADGGASWQPLRGGAVGAVAVRKAAGGVPDRLIIGTGTENGLGDGFWTSDDDGVNWVQRKAFNEWDDVKSLAIAVDPSGTSVYMATNLGLYRGTAAATSWTLVSAFSTAPINDVAMHPNRSGTVFVTVGPNAVGVTPGLYKSGTGSTWTLITDTDACWVPSSDWGEALIGWAPSNVKTIYTIVMHSTNINGRIRLVAMVAKSSTASSATVGDPDTWNVTWRDTGCAGTPGLLSGAAQIEFHSAFAVAPTNSSYLYFGSTMPYRSTDSGGSWEKISYCSTPGVDPDAQFHQDIHHILPFTDATRNGFLLSTDGGQYYHQANAAQPDHCLLTMTALNNQYYSLQFMAVSADPDPSSGNIIVGGTWDQGLWGSTGSAANWRQLFKGDYKHVLQTNTCLNCPGLTSGAHVYYGVTGASDVVTGCDWVEHNPQDYEVLGQSGSGPTVQDPSALANVYSFSGIYLYKYTVGSCSPQPSTPLVSVNAAPTCAAMVGTPGADSRIYVGNGSGTIYRVILDGNISADNLTAPVPWGPIPQQRISGLAVRPGATFAQDVLYVTLGAITPASGYNLGNGNLYRLDAGGWAPLSGTTLPHVPLLCVANDPGNANRLWVGAKHGLYWSDDAGSHWYDGRFNLADVPVNSLAFHPGADALYAGTYGRSIWTSFPSTWTHSAPQGPIREVAAQPPADWNFARSGSILSFDVPEGGEIRIDLFDLQGRKVRDLYSRRLQPGRYEVQSETAGLPPGLYFARLSHNALQVGAVKIVVMN